WSHLVLRPECRLRCIRGAKLVVDAVAGIADPATSRAVASYAPIFSASTGTGMTSTVAHALVERRAFGYDTRNVELWPEVGAHGKHAATIRRALIHATGVPDVPADTTPEDLPSTRVVSASRSIPHADWGGNRHDRSCCEQIESDQVALVVWCDSWTIICWLVVAASYDTPGV